MIFDFEYVKSQVNDSGHISGIIFSGFSDHIFCDFCSNRCNKEHFVKRKCIYRYLNWDTSSRDYYFDENIGPLVYKVINSLSRNRTPIYL